MACLNWDCIIAETVEVALDCLRFINPCIACMLDKYLIDLFVRANNANILKVFDFWTKVSESKSRSRYYRTSHSHEFTCLKMILWFYFPSSLRRIYEIDEICHKMTLLPFIWNHFRFSKSVKSSTAVKFNHFNSKIVSQMAKRINFIILLLNYLIIIKLKLCNINVQNVVSSCQNHKNNLAVASKLLD